LYLVNRLRKPFLFSERIAKFNWHLKSLGRHLIGRKASQRHFCWLEDLLLATLMKPRFCHLKVVIRLNRCELIPLYLHGTVNALTTGVAHPQVTLALRALKYITHLSTILHCLKFLHDLLHFGCESLLLDQTLSRYLLRRCAIAYLRLVSHHLFWSVAEQVIVRIGHFKLGVL
jgi:hypothetical protein